MAESIAQDFVEERADARDRFGLLGEDLQPAVAEHSKYGENATL